MVDGVPRKILVVEDDIDVREILQQVLEVEGHPTLGAANGQEALDALHALKFSPGAPSPVCLILLDLTMPVMDGAQFLRIKETMPLIRGIPVLVVSANDEGLLGLRDQVTDVLCKPVNFEDLLEQVRRYC